MMGDPRGPLDEWEVSTPSQPMIEEDWLPYLISEIAEAQSKNLSNTTYGEITELAGMLHDLGIGDTAELGNLLGAHCDGKKWTFSTTTLPKFAHDTLTDDEYYDLVYEGRHLCGAEPEKGKIDPGYCGIPSREFHNAQIEDPDCWVHTSIERWFERAFEQLQEKNAEKRGQEIVKNDLKILKRAPKLSDRRLAVLATKRKNKNASSD